MKKIIDGRRYDTGTAMELLRRSYGYGGDFAHYNEGLYHTKRGAYFVAGTGGPASHYAESTGQNWKSGGSDIRVLTTSEAQQWLEAEGGEEALEEYFSDSIADG